MVTSSEKEMIRQQKASEPQVKNRQRRSSLFLKASIRSALSSTPKEAKDGKTKTDGEGERREKVLETDDASKSQQELTAPRPPPSPSTKDVRVSRPPLTTHLTNTLRRQTSLHAIDRGGVAAGGATTAAAAVKSSQSSSGLPIRRGRSSLHDYQEKNSKVDEFGVVLETTQKKSTASTMPLTRRHSLSRPPCVIASNSSSSTLANRVSEGRKTHHGRLSSTASIASTRNASNSTTASKVAAPSFRLGSSTPTKSITSVASRRQAFEASAAAANNSNSKTITSPCAKAKLSAASLASSQIPKIIKKEYTPTSSAQASPIQSSFHLPTVTVDTRGGPESSSSGRSPDTPTLKKGAVREVFELRIDSPTTPDKAAKSQKGGLQAIAFPSPTDQAESSKGRGVGEEVVSWEKWNGGREDRRHCRDDFDNDDDDDAHVETASETGRLDLLDITLGSQLLDGDNDDEVMEEIEAEIGLLGGRRSSSIIVDQTTSKSIPKPLLNRISCGKDDKDLGRSSVRLLTGTTESNNISPEVGNAVEEKMEEITKERDEALQQLQCSQRELSEAQEKLARLQEAAEAEVAAQAEATSDRTNSTEERMKERETATTSLVPLLPSPSKVTIDATSQTFSVSIDDESEEEEENARQDVTKLLQMEIVRDGWKQAAQVASTQMEVLEMQRGMTSYLMEHLNRLEQDVLLHHQSCFVTASS